MEKSDDNNHQLSTPSSSHFLIILPSSTRLIDEDRISRFQSDDAEDASESSNVIVRRKKDKEKMPETAKTPLDVTEV